MNPLLLSLWILAAAPAATGSADGGAVAGDARVSHDVAEKVDAYLGAIDTPVPASKWRALGEPGVIALEQIARSDSALPTRRARAVSAAGVIGGARAKTLATELLDPKSAPAVVRQSAVRVLGQLATPAELSRALGPVLRGDPRLGVRGMAAEVLAQRAPAQCAAVEQQAASEDPARRPAYAQALRRCGSKAAR